MTDTGVSSQGTASGSNAPSASGEPVPADVRRAALDRVLKEHVREDRAQLVERTEFEAHLVRGRVVSHERHVGVVAALAVAAAVSLVANLGPALQYLSVAAFLGYACLWAFLAFTGGQEFDTLAVDETGRVTLTREGRPVEFRGDAVRVGLPILVLAVCGFLAFSLARDIVYPPPPHCVPIPSMGPDVCSITPTIEPGTDPTGSISKSNLILIERGLRLLQLAAVTLVTVATALFEWAMLTGRHVLIVSPPEFVTRREREKLRRKTG